MTTTELVLEAAVAPLGAGTDPETHTFGTVMADALRGPSFPFQIRLENLVAGCESRMVVILKSSV